MSAGMALGGAALLALFIVGGRKLLVVIAERKFAALPGRDASKAIKIVSFDEIDDVVGRSRCACKGPMIKIGEGPASSSGIGFGLEGMGSLTRVLTECRYCGRRAALYFDTGTIPN